MVSVNLEYGLNYYEHAAGNNVVLKNCIMPCINPQLLD